VQRHFCLRRNVQTSSGAQQASHSLAIPGDFPLAVKRKGRKAVHSTRHSAEFPNERSYAFLPLHAVVFPILLQRLVFFRFSRLRLSALNNRRQQTTPFRGCQSFNESPARPQLFSLTTNWGPSSFHSTSLQNMQSSPDAFLCSCQLNCVTQGLPSCDLQSLIWVTESWLSVTT